MGSRSRGDTKSVTFDDEEEPTTSFQQRLTSLGTPPQIINPIDPQQLSMGYFPSLQQHSLGGRGRGTFARYRGGGRERGSYTSKKYS